MPAVAALAMIPRPDAQQHTQAQLAGQRQELTHITPAAENKLALHLLMVNLPLDRQGEKEKKTGGGRK